MKDVKVVVEDIFRAAEDGTYIQAVAQDPERQTTD